MIRNPYKEGRRVFWNDPDHGACSAPGKIIEGISDEDYQLAVDSEDDDDLSDFIILVVNDAGGEIECPPHELLPGCVSTGIHGDLTFGFGRPDDHGYFDIGDPAAAREAEKQHKVPVGTYWPFN
jgi:hypothetical protein